MIRINQLKLKVTHSKIEFETAICKALRISREQVLQYKIIKRSTDARKKDNIIYSYVVDVAVANESGVLNKNKNNKDITKFNEVKYVFPNLQEGEVLANRQKLMYRPVIIGTGPAGLFCGLMLARAGYKPIILERGECVEKRQKSVEEFWNGGKLNTNSNVQFGEGGAGTFSDGKLNTLVKDVSGRNKKVLELFAEAGAPEEITYINKPHIGTDILCDVVRNMRKEIESLGGEVRFESQVTDFVIEQDRVKGVVVNGSETIETETIVLAIGHSARDTFEMLLKRGADMEQKAFAVGVRIQHPQQMINVSQYGEDYPDCLPAADYKLTYQASNDRGVYSFCMCPGGFVVNASSEEGRLAINGMSYSDRAGKNANSALIVTVKPEDFENEHPLAGVEFQRRLEEKAYNAANGKIPTQYVGEFLSKGEPDDIKVTPQFKGESVPGANMRDILPGFICDALSESLEFFGHRIKGFDRGDAILAAVESRTSSPVRINRDENFESNIKGLYPCGEGAGYAGGITSAAMDGLKIAEAIAKKYVP
ncbi:MAG: FAD-dependent oxidoreductase [Lachnospiraceae bacterium]|nr:FAD-dependent oxidoreductase [Lachnospiraceae bacterium]